MSELEKSVTFFLVVVWSYAIVGIFSSSGAVVFSRDLSRDSALAWVLKFPFSYTISNVNLLRRSLCRIRRQDGSVIFRSLLREALSKCTMKCSP